MVDQAASRPTTTSAHNTAPSMRVDLREETVTETATPGAPGLGQRMSLDLGQTIKMRGGDLGQVYSLFPMSQHASTKSTYAGQKAGSSETGGVWVRFALCTDMCQGPMSC